MTGSNRGGAGSTWRVVDALNADWRRVLQSGPAPSADWCRRVGLDPAAGLPGLVAQASFGCDQTLHLLLAEAQRGNALAARTVLQSLLGRLVQMASRDPRTPVDDYVGAAWCVLARYPLTARPVRIAANLALDTLKAVRRQDSGRGRAVTEAPWLAGANLEQLVDRETQRRRLDHNAAASVDAAGVIAAGRRLRLLDERTGALLEQVYVLGLSGAEAAQRDGSTAGSVRVRCSRAVGLLAAHAVELTEAA